jgi:hypothetical protein
MVHGEMKTYTQNSTQESSVEGIILIRFKWDKYIGIYLREIRVRRCKIKKSITFS